MASVNKAILIGNLGQNPDMRSMPSGDAVATLSVATTESWKDKASGEKREATEWHRVVFFGRTAEVAGQYLRKGSQIYVEGRIQTRKWTDKDGNERYSTEIRGDVLRMLGSKSSGAPPAPAQAASAPASPAAAPAYADDLGDDGIPF